MSCHLMHNTLSSFYAELGKDGCKDAEMTQKDLLGTSLALPCVSHNQGDRVNILSVLFRYYSSHLAVRKRHSMINVRSYFTSCVWRNYELTFCFGHTDAFSYANCNNKSVIEKKIILAQATN